MKDITCPALVIRGEDDWAVPEYECRELMARMINAKNIMWKSVPRMGHFITVEAPQIVCEAMEEFLADL
jgi:pimeloyl-ACP methyl ester carboxylesterase